jgi:hypothetical protein
MRAQAVRQKIVNRLRDAAGGCVSTDELLQAIYYGGSGDDEPDWSMSALRVQICILRRMGFPIDNKYGEYRYAGRDTIPLGDRAYPPEMRIGDLILGAARTKRKLSLAA